MSFPLAFMLGFSVASLPGPILALIVSETLRRGPVSGVLVLTAPLLVDALVMIPAAFFVEASLVPGKGWGVLGFIGAALLVWLGAQSIRGDVAVPAAVREAPWAPSYGEMASFLKGVLTHLTNPYPYIYWGTVGVVFVRQGMEQGGIAGALRFPLGFWTGAAALNLLVLFVSARGRQLASPRWMPYLHRLCGLVLIGCAILVGVKAWLGLF